MTDLASTLRDRIHAHAARTPQWAYQVALENARKAHSAKHVLEGRFSAFEFAVQEAAPSRTPDNQIAVFNYASSTLGEWPEAKKHIISNADLAVRYAEQVKKGPWSDDHPVHDTIATDDAALERYSRAFPYVVNTRQI